MSENNFTCPRCGCHEFTRDVATSDGLLVVLDTVRCKGSRCKFRGEWPTVVTRVVCIVPDALYQRLEERAETEGVKPQRVVLDMIAAFFGIKVKVRTTGRPSKRLPGETEQEYRRRKAQERAVTK